jgi:hypothetical protein
MGADSSAENTPNTPKFICLIPKVLDFNEKRFHWASVVRGTADLISHAQFVNIFSSKISPYAKYSPQYSHPNSK